MMKKKYLIPIVEIVASQLDDHLMDHSYGWADAKGSGLDDQEGDEDIIENKKLWAD